MLKSLISISFLLFLIGSPQSLRAQDQEAKVEISSKPNKVSAGISGSSITSSMKG